MEHEFYEFRPESALLKLSWRSLTLSIWQDFRWRRVADYVLEKFTLVGKYLNLHEQLQVIRANTVIRVLFYRKVFDRTDRVMSSYRDTLEAWTLDVAAEEARFEEDLPAQSEGLAAFFATAGYSL